MTQSPSITSPILEKMSPSEWAAHFSIPVKRLTGIVTSALSKIYYADRDLQMAILGDKKAEAREKRNALKAKHKEKYSDAIFLSEEIQGVIKGLLSKKEEEQECIGMIKYFETETGLNRKEFSEVWTSIRLEHKDWFGAIAKAWSWRKIFGLLCAKKWDFDALFAIEKKKKIESRKWEKQQDITYPKWSWSKLRWGITLEDLGFDIGNWNRHIE